MRSSRRQREKLSDSSRDQRRVPRLLLESLEPRTMMTASPLASSVVCQPNLSFFAGAGFNVYSPAQIRHAYGFDQVSWNGAGQTIAIVDAYDDPTVAADLHKFDRQFGLADPKLTVAKMTSNGRGPAFDSGWAMEIALDVEWAHAIAPGASILLVEANSASLGSLLSAVNYARNQAGVSVVSMSWGAGEFSSEGSFDSYFTTPAGHGGVTFVASSGDSGAPAGWPSISSNVLAVGGTTLTLGAGGSYGGEKGWSGSGGGYSPYESEPGYQRGFQNTGHRSNPDVAYDADPYSGFYVCDSASGGSWYAVGGTSAGAPQWAGLIAIANQGRAAAGRAPLSSALQAIYSLANADFHDVTSGNNGYAAGLGYDAVTGRGSPIANLLVRDLVAYGATTTTATHSTASVTTTNQPIGGRMQRADEIGGDVFLEIGTTTNASTSGFSAPGQQIAGSSIDRWTADAISTMSARLSVAPISRDVSLADVGTSLADAPITEGTTVGSPADRVNSLPDAVFENSLPYATDPFAALDRIDRLVNRYLESDAALDAARDRGFAPDRIDACLVDRQSFGAGDRDKSSATTPPSTSGHHTATIPFAAAAFCLMIESGWTRGPTSDDATEKNRHRRSS